MRTTSSRCWRVANSPEPSILSTNSTGLHPPRPPLRPVAVPAERRARSQSKSSCIITTTGIRFSPGCTRPSTASIRISRSSPSRSWGPPRWPSIGRSSSRSTSSSRTRLRTGSAGIPERPGGPPACVEATRPASLRGKVGDFGPDRITAAGRSPEAAHGRGRVRGPSDQPPRDRTSSPPGCRPPIRRQLSRYKVERLVGKSEPSAFLLGNGGARVRNGL